MSQAEAKEYIHWMCNPENEFCCGKCPENQGFTEWPENRLPCGQFQCWVTMHCKEDAS